MHSRNLGRGCHAVPHPLMAASPLPPWPFYPPPPTPTHSDKASRNDQTHPRTWCDEWVDVTLPRSRAGVGTAALTGKPGAPISPPATADRHTCLVCLPLLSSPVLESDHYLHSVMACLLVIGQKQFVLDPVSLAIFAPFKHLPIFAPSSYMKIVTTRPTGLYSGQ